MRLCTVRGHGMLQCVTFDSAVLDAMRSSRIYPAACTDWPPNLLLHVYLERVHRVRVRPSLCNPNALLLDLPASACAEPLLGRVCSALEKLCELLAAAKWAPIFDAVRRPR
uniref:Uncharacterized protein n=1 Tax=Calcidiscus leptoporus TaxID=127549 RepID=A0A7S0JB90_9EUKA